MTRIGVDCVTSSDGSVQVRKVQVGQAWQPVEQGRQWQDAAGRHVLVMWANQEVREILLRAETLIWELKPPSGGKVAV